MAGKLADTYGRKAVMVSLVVLTVVGSLTCTLVTSMWQLLLARVVYGMGMPLYNVGGYIFYIFTSCFKLEGICME